MITSAQELIDKLLKYYHKTEEASTEVIDALKAYVRRINLNESELDRIYEVIVENCAAFPNVRVVAKLWKENKNQFSDDKGYNNSRDVNNARDIYKHTGHDEIVTEIKIIRDKQSRDEILSNKEIDLIDTYEDLCYVYNQVNALPDGVIDRVHKETYIRKAKETIDAGIPINFTAFEREMNRRRNQAVEMYGENDSEIDSKLCKSVGDMQKAFGANSKMLEPEPDKQVSFKY